MIVGVIAAGGSGERLGASVPKAFVAVGGQELYAYSASVLRHACDRVVLVGPSEREGFVIGGPSRSESVRAGVLAEPEADVYVVHDAARPFVTVDLVQRCLDGLEGFDGAIAAAPVTDTVKEADGAGRVVRTLDRSALWAIQTPQVFRGDVLRRALDVSAETLAAATDDAALVEAAGGSVRVVESSPKNFKITTAADLQRAEALLAD